MSAIFAVTLSTAVPAQQPPPKSEVGDVSQRRARLVALASQRETALLFKAYWFTAPQSHYSSLEVYCTGMAYARQYNGFFIYADFSPREEPKLLNAAQLRQVKDLIKALTLGASESARSYRTGQKVVTVTFWDGREYKQREYHSIYELPPAVVQIAAVVGAAKPAQSISSETRRFVWAVPEGVVCDEPEESFDAEGASRTELMKQATKRHLYLRQRRDLLKIYLRRFYDEKDTIDGYIKKYVESTADQR